jgi:hypothetical protein
MVHKYMQSLLRPHTDCDVDRTCKPKIFIRDQPRSNHLKQDAAFRLASMRLWSTRHVHNNNNTHRTNTNRLKPTYLQIADVQAVQQSVNRKQKQSNARNHSINIQRTQSQKKHCWRWHRLGRCKIANSRVGAHLGSVNLWLFIIIVNPH